MPMLAELKFRGVYLKDYLVPKDFPEIISYVLSINNFLISVFVISVISIMIFSLSKK